MSILYVDLFLVGDLRKADKAGCSMVVALLGFGSASAKSYEWTSTQLVTVAWQVRQTAAGNKKGRFL